MNGLVLGAAAVAAGAVSASSPCVLPVLPGYLAAVSSTDGSDSPQANASLVGALGFVGGFTLVFTALGATASALGDALFTRLDLLLKIAGALLIALGLQAWGIIHVRAFSAERRLVQPHRVGVGRSRSFAIGIIFALGWTPCVGPILAVILTKAAADASLIQGVGLLLLYSAGLGIPFLALALWFERSRRIRSWLQRQGRTLQRLSGTTMILAGIGYISGIWSTLFTHVQALIARTGWPPL